MARYHRSYRRSSSPTFHDFAIITARFDSECTCGAKLKQGDNIAYAKGTKAKCMDCYNNWSDEVREEQQMCDRNQAIMGGWG